MDRSAFQLPDAGGKFVDKISVMGHKQQRAAELLHRIFNPLPGGNVQMVGRLVQNQDINILIHQNAKLQAAQFAAGENGHTLEHVLPPKMEGRQTVAGRLRRTIRLINHGVHQIAFTVGEGDDLRKVRRLDGRAGLDTSAQRLFLSQKKLQKGRFTGS